MRDRILLLLLCAATALGHGATEDLPPPEQPPPPQQPPRTDPRAPPVPPSWPPEGPEAPVTNRPKPPEADPPAPEAPKGHRPSVRPDILTRRRGSGGENEWRVFWEYNREHLLGLRSLLAGKIVITGKEAAETDPLGPHRARVLDALRKAARTDDERLVRAAALIALGRMGTDADAWLLVDTLKDGRASHEVREAAAVGLGVLPPIENAGSLKGTRDYLVWVLGEERALPGRARGMVILAAGLRAREDAIVKAELLSRAAAERPRDGQEAAHLALACGYARDPLVAPELLEAVRKGALKGERLSDRERAHAATALALTGDPNAAEMLAKVLPARRTGIDTKRSAALGLGRLLREGELPEAVAVRSARALRLAFQKENDAILRGYAAVGLGAARPPQSAPVLMEAIDHGGNMSVKPYCALALGLAARTLGHDESRDLRVFLRAELDKTNHPELSSALALALGLARAREAEEVLREMFEKTSLPAPVRGAAAQALGLLESGSTETTNSLAAVARSDTQGRILEDAVLALGLMGHRAIARDLARVLPHTSTSHAKARIMLALTYLRHADAVEPLLDILERRDHPSLVREFAAAALGLLGDRRKEDALFATDAWFNLHATTPSTHEWVRLY